MTTFSTIDLASVFRQIEMAQQDIEKRHLEWNMEIMSTHMDDVFLYSTSLQEHIHNLRKVFQRFRDPT